MCKEKKTNNNWEVVWSDIPSMSNISKGSCKLVWTFSSDTNDPEMTVIIPPVICKLYGQQHREDPQSICEVCIHLDL